MLKYAYQQPWHSLYTRERSVRFEYTFLEVSYDLAYPFAMIIPHDEFRGGAVAPRQLCPCAIRQATVVHQSAITARSDPDDD